MRERAKEALYIRMLTLYSLDPCLVDNITYCKIPAYPTRQYPDAGKYYAKEQRNFAASDQLHPHITLEFRRFGGFLFDVSCS